MLLATALISQSTLRFAVIGLATGALTALVALSIVIVHRVSGVLNFAAGALGAVGAFVCYALRDTYGWPATAAVLVGLLVGLLLGLFTYLVMAFLRESSLLSRLIATLALLSSAQSAMVLAWEDQLSQPDSLLPTKNVELIGELRIGQDRLILIIVALVLAAALAAVYRWTLFGLATSAVSESRRVASAARWRPNRIEAVNFAVAGVVSALAAILLAPILTLNAAVLSLAVLPALAAALVGKFSSFPITVGAALAIGVLQSELALFQPDIADGLGVSAASLTGLPQSAPLLVILVVTVVAGRLRPARGEVAVRLPFPGSGRRRPLALAVVAVLGLLLVVGANGYSDALVTTFGMAIIVASVVVVSGYAGQLSLCQFALAGFGAWAAARSVSSLGVSFPVAVLLGVAAAVGVGVLVALPALRTRGVSLAIVTLALSLVFSSLIFRNASLTGGFEGIQVDSPRLFGLDVDPIRHSQRYAALLLVALIIVALLVSNLRSSAAGRQLIAVRSNERAAAAVGVRVVGAKVYAFAVGSGIAALGGILLAFRQPNVQFASFDVFGSILLVQYAVLGGLGWISGVVIGASAAPGAIVTQLVGDLLHRLDDVEAWIVVFSGIGVVQLLRRAPDGIASMLARPLRRIELWLPRRHEEKDSTSNEDDRTDQDDLTGQSLDVQNLSVRFGGVLALSDVSFSVAPGEVVGLIGPNGAGKTTMLDVITGFTRQSHGSVRLDGTDVSRWSPERRARSGMARSWQGVELFEELTVRENLLVAQEAGRRTRHLRNLLWPHRPSLGSLAESIVDDLGLVDVLDERPASLPYGVNKLVGIARAFVTSPGVLLLDEPAAGLDNVETGELASLIRRLADRYGLTVVVIEHDMALILNTCDRIVVLDFGTKIADGSPDEVRRSEAVVAAYLGAVAPTAAATATAAREDA